MDSCDYGKMFCVGGQQVGGGGGEERNEKRRLRERMVGFLFVVVGEIHLEGCVRAVSSMIWVGREQKIQCMLPKFGMHFLFTKKTSRCCTPVILVRLKYLSGKQA